MNIAVRSSEPIPAGKTSEYSNVKRAISIVDDLSTERRLRDRLAPPGVAQSVVPTPTKKVDPGDPCAGKSRDRMKITKPLASTSAQMIHTGVFLVNTGSLVDAMTAINVIAPRRR